MCWIQILTLLNPKEIEQIIECTLLFERKNIHEKKKNENQVKECLGFLLFIGFIYAKINFYILLVNLGWNISIYIFSLWQIRSSRSICISLIFTSKIHCHLLFGCLYVFVIFGIFSKLLGIIQWTSLDNVFSITMETEKAIKKVKRYFSIRSLWKFCCFIWK